ncbi:hypothetical protein HAX54_037494, partial [Datura stramonium]|nr:hypothetical protein [Datura stramonium]
TDRRSLVYRCLGLAKHRMKHRLGYRSSSHFPRPALHRCSVGPNQRNADVAPDKL